MMVKTIRQIGNRYGIIIDRAVLDLLGIDAQTQLEVTIQDNGLLLRPWQDTNDRKARVRRSANRMATIHRKALKELAD
jgi:antitoxin component of MazEF toxin-antitoxin module